MPDGADTTVPDTGPDGCEIQSWYIDSDGDGYGMAGSRMEACEKPDGYVDNADDCDDSDADINPDAAETCDGTDENCNGTDDSKESSSELEASDCQKQDGVCSGATVARCNQSGSDYATCGADQYGDDYHEADDEDWRCDSKDNDCDGDSDEACCDDGMEPTPAAMGAPNEVRSGGAITAASENAEDEAVFAVAFTQKTKLYMWHVDETGSKVEEGVISFGDNPFVDEVVAHPDGYEVIGYPESRATQLVSYRFDAGLSERSSSPLEIDSVSGTNWIRSQAVARDGDRIWVAYAKEDINGDWGLRATSLDWNQSFVNSGYWIGDQTFGRGPRPEIAVVSGTPVVVWWAPMKGQVRGARLVQSGMVQNRFGIPVTPKTNNDMMRIAAVTADGALHVIHPEWSNNDMALRHVRVERGETGDMVGTATEITDFGLNKRRPAVAAFDSDGDETADDLMVVWQGQDAGTVDGGTISLGSVSKMDVRTYHSAAGYVTNPGVAEASSRIGLAWEDGGKDDVWYAPASIDGVPICGE
jgi:hypothetical protein